MRRKAKSISSSFVSRSRDFFRIVKFESASASNEDASNVSDVLNGLELCPCACVYRTSSTFSEWGALLINTHTQAHIGHINTNENGQLQMKHANKKLHFWQFATNEKMLTNRLDIILLQT